MAPLLIYDGNCEFCRRWVERWKGETKDRITYAPFQKVGNHFPNIARTDFEQSVQLVMPDGRILRGAQAVFTLLSFVPGKGLLLWLYEHFFGFALLSELVYRFVSNHRCFFSSLTAFLFGKQFKPQTYLFATHLFPKVLALIYLIAFFSFWHQVAGLIGENGILPVQNYLSLVSQNYGVEKYWLLPTLFWLSASDAALHVVSIVGIAFAILLLFGKLKRVSLILLYLCYLSLVSAGQVFMHFQWDILLLEVGFLSIFLSASPIPLFLFRWLLFRFVFLSGAVKLLSGDPTWRNLTALTFHYKTQPLPNPISWYANLLPTWFHTLSVASMFAIELAVPFLIFAPRTFRLFAAFAITFLETLILFTGNYTFFNFLTIALCLFLLDDTILSRIIPSVLRKSAAKAVLPAVPQPVAQLLNVVVVTLSFSLIVGVFGRFIPLPFNYLVEAVSPFHIVNTYGLFAVMTTRRPEIIVEGSNDQKVWHAYEFMYKPGDPKRPPPLVAPHQPRLDWQMWFVALGSYQNAPWFTNFVTRLLQGSPEVLSLLARNPYPKRPPTYIRALLYEYTFTDFATRARTGNWWQRDFRGIFFPIASLSAQTRSSVVQ